MNITREAFIKDLKRKELQGEFTKGSGFLQVLSVPSRSK